VCDRGLAGVGIRHREISRAKARRRPGDLVLGAGQTNDARIKPDTVMAFTAVAQEDPACAMGYWGLAMSQRPVDCEVDPIGWTGNGLT
jgi:hypothetical protein